MMDTQTRNLLAGSLRELLAAPGVDVGAALDELGWAEVLADDPRAATTLLFLEHGRALARSNVLDSVVLDELASILPAAAAAAHCSTHRWAARPPPAPRASCSPT